jgi:hypothetical protein
VTLDEVVEGTQRLRQKVVDGDGGPPIDDPRDPVILAVDPLADNRLYAMRLRQWLTAMKVVPGTEEVRQ